MWQVVQASSNNESATPAVREKKIELDADRAKAGFVGFATGWALRAVVLYELQKQARMRGIELQGLPKGLPLRAVDEDGGGFLSWAYEAMQEYLTQRKASTFIELMETKALKLGVKLAS